MKEKDYKSYSVDELDKLKTWELLQLAEDQLITCDGKGKEVKSDILKEIKSRLNWAEQEADYYAEREAGPSI